MTDHVQRKRQLIAESATYRAQAIRSGNTVRKGISIAALAAEAKRGAAEIVREKLHAKQKRLQEIMPAVLDNAAAAASVSTRYLRKPVLYGAMILGAISVLPRFFIGRKSK